MENFQTSISSGNPITTNSKQLGFSLILLLALLPLALLLMWGVFTTVAIIQLKALPLQLCRLSNLKIQQQNKSAIDELFSLNAQVQQLRIQKKINQVQLIAAIGSGNIAAIAMNQATLRRIAINQEQIFLRQVKIQLYHKESQERVSLQQRTIMNQKFKDLAKNLSSLVTAHLEELNIEAPPLAIEVKSGSNNPTDPAVFGRQKNFSRQQRSHAFWKTSVRATAGNLVSLLLRSPATWQVDCSASLIKEGIQWQPRLLQADRS